MSVVNDAKWFLRSDVIFIPPWSVRRGFMKARLSGTAFGENV